MKAKFARWEHDKEREHDGISDVDGDDDKQYKRGQQWDVSWNFLDVQPLPITSPNDRWTLGSFYKKYFGSLSTKQNTIRPTGRAAF